MAKRTGANGRKKNAGRARGTKTRLRVPLFITALAAITVAGFLVIGARGNHFGALMQKLPLYWSQPAMARQVVIQGAVQVNPDELLRRSGIVFPVKMDQLKKVYLGTLQGTSPWIEKIRIIGTQGKNGAVILGVRERKPVALLQAGAICLVDAAGVCLPLGVKTGYDLPLLSGLADTTGSDGVRRLAPASVARMNRFFNDAAGDDGSFIKRITQVDFGRAGSSIVRIMLEGSATELVINENDCAGCIEKYLSLRETLQGDSLQPARIDLAYRNLAFVTPETVPKPFGAGESIAKKTKG